jgi:hypothetical protein
MKNFIIALVIGVVLCNMVGALASELWGLHFMLGSESVSFFESMFIFSGIAILMVVITFTVALSIAATIGLAMFGLVLGLVFTGVGVFWPILLIIGLYYACRTPKSGNTRSV